MRPLLLCCFLILTNFVGLCQSADVDSLRVLLNTTERDTNRVIILNRLAFSFFRIAPDSSLSYANRAMTLASELNYYRGVGNSYNSLGIVAYSQSRYSEALEHYQQFLNVMKEIADSTGTHKALNNIGLVQKNMGEYPNALAHFQKSLFIQKRLGSIEDIGKTLNNMGPYSSGARKLCRRSEYVYASRRR